MAGSVASTAVVDDPLALAARWYDQGFGVVLATVTDTWGSSPRPVGSRMVIGSHGAIGGSVSGGCIEAAVVTAAAEVLAERRPRVLRFGVSDGDAWAIGLACGGEIRVLLETVGMANA